MRVLLYSAVLYLTGVALVLYFRPSLMFKHDGRWKEFGVDGVDTTYFPFWLFCIVWAVVAHGIIHIVYSDVDNSSPATIAATTAASIPSLTQRVVEPTEEAKPGYYKLDSSLMKRKGVPRYIYVGQEVPQDLE